MMIVNSFGKALDFDAVVNVMDDETREAVAAEGIESEQEFFDRYCEAHRERFGEDFPLDVPNPQY